MQARRIARELALLSLSQVSSQPDRLQDEQLQTLIVSSVRTLTAEVRDTLETAVSELERGSNRLLTSQTRAADIQSARAMVQEAIDLTQKAVNQLGIAVDLPEFIQLANQKAVRDYALELLRNIQSHRPDVDKQLSEAIVDWQLNRLARIDRDILRIAVVEMQFLGVPNRVAINEAVELAKRYSEEEGFRFINGVLRRVSDRFSNPGSSEPINSESSLA